MDDNLPELCVLLADRGYNYDNVRKTMEARNPVPVIPMRKTRKLRVAGSTNCATSSSGASTSSKRPPRRHPLGQDRRKHGID